jgi:pyruvate/2-oxoglutarate dehydrogenase complex dihydrolipoamide dehydrogenase (E3) component
MAEASPTEHYDAVIIGSGQAAKPLGIALALAGKRTALVERTHVGGTCINEGCSPTKTMVASARVAWLARRAGDYGVTTDNVTVDLHRVRARKEAIVDRFRSGSEKQIRGTEGLELIEGEASFLDSRTLSVGMNGGGSRRITSDWVFVNTGCRPEIPDLPGMADVPALDSTSIMELTTIPDHLVVMGGGYIGLEFGQMFRRFGSRVTIVQRGRQLLNREDEDVAEAVATILREDGIDVRLETRAVRVRQSAGEGVVLEVAGPAGEATIEGSHLLVATGRIPNTDRLQLSRAGVNTDSRGFIPVNERLETNVPGVYALGDVNGGPAFTHISYDDYRIVKANLLDGGDRTTKGRLVPYTVFVDPQLGRVGLTEIEASHAGRSIRVARMPMTHVARALEVGETRGFMKIVVDKKTDEILGCAILGLEGGEIMSAIQIAMMGGVRWTALRDAVFAHPTIMESLNNVFGKWGSS